MRELVVACLLLLVASPAMAEKGCFEYHARSETHARDQYVIDTCTGRVWIMVVTHKGGRSVLQAIPYIRDLDDEMLDPESEASSRYSTVPVTVRQERGR